MKRIVVIFNRVQVVIDLIDLLGLRDVQFVAGRGVTFFPYQKKFAKIYDSYRLFDNIPAPVAGGGDGGDREAVGPQVNPPAAVPGEVALVR